MKCCCDNGSVSFVLYFQILYKLKSFLSNINVITCTSFFCTCYNLYFWIVQVITSTVFLYMLTCTKLQHVHDIYIYIYIYNITCMLVTIIIKINLSSMSWLMGQYRKIRNQTPWQMICNYGLMSPKSATITIRVSHSLQK
jgi:hypothetical protein